MGNTGSPHVPRRDADAVFIATATEPSRKHKAKSSDLVHPAQKERIRKKADDLVEKGRKRVEKEEKGKK